MTDFANLSLLAELILSITLLFIWLMQRQERHALYWGLGEVALGLITLFWQSHHALAQESGQILLLTVLMLGGIAGYWCGTRFFLGKPIWPLRLGITLALLAALPITAGWIAGFYLTATSGLAILAIMFLVCGFQLHQEGAYRIVGWILVWRGLNNLLFIFAFSSQDYLPAMFVLAFLAKVASIFALLYALLHELNHRYGSTLATLTDGFLTHDENGMILSANPALACMLGQSSASDLIGKYVYDFQPDLDPELIHRIFSRINTRDAHFPLIYEHRMPGKNAIPIPIETSITPFHERGQTRLMIQIRDITDRKEHEQQLQRLASIDEVSGLFNRNALNIRLADVIAARLAAHRECALLFIDLDHFKRINDTLGHTTGDALLKEAGLRLRQVTGEQDLVARFGGDEFVIALADIAPESMQERAVRIADAVLARFAEPFTFDQIAAIVTPSIGIAICPEHGEDANTLLRHADAAMYAAKHAGRNEMRIFDDSMNAESEMAIQIDMALRTAIAGNELSLVYQPIVDAQQHRIKKVEALVRWHNPRLGTIAPDRFIPVAEESGYIVELGNWVLREACRQRGQWQDGPLADTVLSVNISAWQLADKRFAHVVESCLQEACLQPRQLELELTERVLIEEESCTRATLLCLQDMGISLSLDDFGTGYSSLNYLTRFHLDTLKVDRSFVHDIETNGRSLHLTQAIISMGGSLEISLVAEGVETEEQATLLRDMGCQYLQGYFFSKPLPASQLLEKYRPT